MNRDNTIFELIEKEHQRQLKGIELIASENFVSEDLTLPTSMPKAILATVIMAVAKWSTRLSS